MSDGDSNQESEIQRPRFRKANAQPRNWLTPVLLASLREWNSYGYQLIKQTTAFGYKTTNPGTFYRTLRRMEEQGMVKSFWETDGKEGPARRMYSITDIGEAYLEFWVKGLEQYQQMLDAFFRLYTGTPSRKVKDKSGLRPPRDG
jgi:PadR family transcriptional regulator PadR